MRWFDKAAAVSATFAAPAIELAAMVGHRQVYDFHLLDLAVAHGRVVVTLDRAMPTYLAGSLRDSVFLIPVD